MSETRMVTDSEGREWEVTFPEQVIRHPAEARATALWITFRHRSESKRISPPDPIDLFRTDYSDPELLSLLAEAG